MEGFPLTTQVGLDDRQIADRLVYLGFVHEDGELLRSLRPWVESVADAFLREFYDHQFSHAEFREVVQRAGSNRQRLAEFQRAYLLSLFDGEPDAAYIESRLRIGAVHAQLGITPRWYVNSYELYSWYFYPMIRRRFWYNPRKARRVIRALSKLLNFDRGLALDMYVQRVAGNVQAREEIVRLQQQVEQLGLSVVSPRKRWQRSTRPEPNGPGVREPTGTP